ncbi:hypothetical protein KIH87_08960 [Paraneptunicella aestuarii]|uniref:hypothetical protein n=1 Tax=Paraneptunicella aestuarii TaxID=2831148 RepID=UPI001E428E39|nr:hypothetical protein [Paraneptunicella aestuarii]UAA40444.1 hypothetical protein KIH87_08960 [Paraneptunicella aestuarii]
MYSLITPNISKKIAFIAGLIACCIGVFTFGKALWFDRIYLVLLLLASAYSYHIDKNIFGIFVILSLERVFEESIYLLAKDTWTFKILVVVLCTGACYKLRYDRMIWVAAGALSSVIAADIYWYLIDYPAPKIYWSLVILFQSLMVRHFIFFRPAIMERHFPEWREIRWINSDWQIYQLMMVFVVMELLFLGEYYVRHIFGYTNVLVVFTLYPYAAHTVASIIIWIILSETIRMTRDRYLMA